MDEAVKFYGPLLVALAVVGWMFARGVMPAFGLRARLGCYVLLGGIFASELELHFATKGTFGVSHVSWSAPDEYRESPHAHSLIEAAKLSGVVALIGFLLILSDLPVEPAAKHPRDEERWKESKS